MNSATRIPPSRRLAVAEIKRLPYETCGEILLNAINDESQLVACFAVPEPDTAVECSIFFILANQREAILTAMASEPGQTFSSLSPKIPQLHLFEREMAEQYGLSFTGHPWFKPVRFHGPINRSNSQWASASHEHPLIGDIDYFQVEGDEIHEVGVGPVHAGIIEPGHFRFQCYGEKVLHLEISLGYQHRGIEARLQGSPNQHQALMQIETIAGDSSVAHITAYAQAIEALAKTEISERAATVRAIALELERLANHVGDIGALAGDVGFLPSASFCGRLRGDYLNMTAAICGSRFGRGLVRPGGVLFDVDEALAKKLLALLGPVARDTRGALDLFFETPSVLARLEGTGIVSAKKAFYLGLVGIAGRACGIDCDVRRLSGGTNTVLPLPAILEDTGDVYARALIRRQEVAHSIDCIRQVLTTPTSGQKKKKIEKLAPNCLAVGLTEGWRGRVCHILISGHSGEIRRHKIIDPSFFNWSGLAMALRNEQISDFPLCNKSFNLSYCGFDL